MCKHYLEVSEEGLVYGHFTVSAHVVLVDGAIIPKARKVVETKKGDVEKELWPPQVVVLDGIPVADLADSIDGSSWKVRFQGLLRKMPLNERADLWKSRNLDWEIAFPDRKERAKAAVNNAVDKSAEIAERIGQLAAFLTSWDLMKTKEMKAALLPAFGVESKSGAEKELERLRAELASLKK